MVCPYAVLTELMVYCIPNFTDIKNVIKNKVIFDRRKFTACIK